MDSASGGFRCEDWSQESISDTTPPQNLRRRLIDDTSSGSHGASSSSFSTSRKYGSQNQESINNPDENHSDLSRKLGHEKRRFEVEDFDYIHFVTFLGMKRIKIIPQEDLEPSTLTKAVGKGASMVVEFTRLKGEIVAIKRPNQPSATSKDTDELRRLHLKWLHDLYFEVQIMSHKPLCDHPNIVKLIGITFENSSRIPEFMPLEMKSIYPALIVEPAHCDYADLSLFLEQSDKLRGLSLSIIFNLISDIADGLAALHSYMVIHGDIKPKNILMFPASKPPHITAKICDFSFSSILRGPNGDRDKWRFTKGWAAPEVSFQAYPTMAGDVYSFGLVCAFIAICGTEAPSEFLDIRQTPERLTQAVESFLAARQTMNSDYSINSVAKLIRLLQRVLDKNPGNRPKSLLNTRHELLGTPSLDLYHEVGYIPFRTSIKRPANESPIHDMAMDDANEALKAIWAQLPSHLKQVFLDNMYSHLESVSNIWEHKSGRVYRALCAYWVLHGTNDGLRIVDSIGDVRLNPAANYNLMKHLFQGQERELPLPRGFTPLLPKGIIQLFPEIIAIRDNPEQQLDNDEWKELVNRRVDTFSSLHVAAHLGQVQLCQKLIKLGCDVNGASDSGCTPLHLAAFNLDVSTGKKLLQNGAEIDYHCEFLESDFTPLLLVFIGAEYLKFSQSPILGIKTHREGRDYLQRASDFLTLLLENKADPWFRSKLSYYGTSINLLRDESLVEILLKYDRRLARTRNIKGQTPLFSATENGNFGVVKVLLKYGADPNIQDQRGRSALHWVWPYCLNWYHIQETFWPWVSLEDVLPPLIKTRIKQMPNAAFRGIRTLLIESGADPMQRDTLDGLPPCSVAFVALLNFCPPNLDRGLYGSVQYDWTDATTTHAEAWFEDSYSSSNTGFITQTARILRPTTNGCISVCQNIIEAVLVDNAWGYNLIMEMARLPCKGNDLVINIVVKKLDANMEEGETLLNRYDTSSMLLPKPNCVYKVDLGLVRFSKPCDLTVQVHLIAPHGWHGGLALISVMFLLEAALVTKLSKGKHTYSTTEGDIYNMIEQEKNFGSLLRLGSHKEIMLHAPRKFPGLSHFPAPNYLPWLNHVGGSWQVNMANMQRTGTLVPTFAISVLIGHWLLVCCSHRWWTLIFWPFLVFGRCMSEQVILEQEGKSMGYLDFHSFNSTAIFIHSSWIILTIFYPILVRYPWINVFLKLSFVFIWARKDNFRTPAFALIVGRNLLAGYVEYPYITWYLPLVLHPEWLFYQWTSHWAAPYLRKSKG